MLTKPPNEISIYIVRKERNNRVQITHQLLADVIVVAAQLHKQGPRSNAIYFGKHAGGTELNGTVHTCQFECITKTIHEYTSSLTATLSVLPFISLQTNFLPDSHTPFLPYLFFAWLYRFAATSMSSTWNDFTVYKWDSLAFVIPSTPE